MGAKMRKADKSGATWALIVGDREAEEESVTVKWLRKDREQETVPLVKLGEILEER